MGASLAKRDVEGQLLIVSQRRGFVELFLGTLPLLMSFGSISLFLHMQEVSEGGVLGQGVEVFVG